MNTDALDALVQGALGTVYSAASVQVRWKGEVVYYSVFGTLDPDGRLEQGERTTYDTLFDFASLTKLYTASACFRLLDAGIINLETPLSKVLPEFSGTRAIAPYPTPSNTGVLVHGVPTTGAQFDAGAVTFRQLLTHSSGLPAWLNLRAAGSVSDRLRMCLDCPFAYPPGTQVIYSDVGFILLGLAVAHIDGQPLKQAMRSLISRPFGLSVRYGPLSADVAPTEFCQWRGRRLVGEVHDENCAALDGVSGHAGLFGTATDAAALGQIYLDDGDHLLSKGIVREATRAQIGDRGLGWMMRSPDGSSSGHYFSGASYGHTGFVGNSLWVDPKRKLVCALLTNTVIFGRNRTPIDEFRKVFHDTVIEALEGNW